MVRYWNALTESSAGNALVCRLIDEWHALIDDEKARDVEIQAFLADHAGFFFYDTDCYGFPVAGLRLGDDRVDFMQPEDQYGLGATYKLIKAGSPHTPAFDADGRATKELIEAHRAVEGWRLWIEANWADATRLFPSTQVFDRHLRISYLVIMGRRPADAPRGDRYPEFGVHGGERNRFPDLGRHHDAEVHSFDNLTEWLSRRRNYDAYLPAVRWELKQLTAEVRNTLASPFHRALHDAEWRNIVSGCDGFVSHMTARLADKLVAHLEPGPRLKEFDRIWGELTPEESRKIEDIAKMVLLFS
jgi:hypothetical protein